MAARFDRSTFLRFIHDPHSHRGIGFFLSFVVILGLAGVLPLIHGCGDNCSIQRPTLGVNGYVRLENQSDHSGVLLRMAELDSTAVTDSTGLFSFSGIPDGHWELTAIYPFFERDTTEVELADGLLQGQIDITLEQLLQFWVEPADTTVAMSQSDDEHHFSLVLWGYLSNLSDHAVTVKAAHGPRALVAIRPLAAAASEYCDELYGWLSPNDTIDWFVLTFEPGETRLFPLGAGRRYRVECFEPGPYEISWCVSDEFNYRGHFNRYGDLNRTLLAKRELFRPATVTLVQQDE